MRGHPELVITIPLVLFGLFRYWFVVASLAGGEVPTDVLLSDCKQPDQTQPAINSNPEQNNANEKVLP